MEKSITVRELRDCLNDIIDEDRLGGDLPLIAVNSGDGIDKLKGEWTGVTANVISILIPDLKYQDDCTLILKTEKTEEGG